MSFGRQEIDAAAASIDARASTINCPIPFDLPCSSTDPAFSNVRCLHVSHAVRRTTVPMILMPFVAPRCG
jgi:hypothetical protein